VYALTERLVARSLVLAEDYGSNTRFRLLETIRQYGEERLGATGDVVALRRRHADYYVALASELAPQVFGPDQIAYGNQLFAENENFLAAIAYAIDNGDVDGAFRWFRTMPGPSSQLGRIQRLPTDAMLAMAGAHDHPDYQFGVAMAAVFEGQRGDRPASRRHMEEAREISRRRGVPLDGDIEGMLAASEITHAMAMGAWSEAAAMSERNTDSLRGRARPGQIANALGGTAALHATAGNTEHAAALASEGLALAREVGMPTAIAMNLAALASALADREPTRARMLLRESIDVRARLGYETANELSEGVLASARIRDWPMAFELAARAAPLIAWNNDRPQLAGVLNVVARAVADDDPEAAAVLHGASRRLALASIPAASAAAPAAGSATGAAGPPPGGGLIADLRREATTIIDRRIGADRRRVLRDEGERLDDEQAVAYVLEVVARASAAGAG
jgi:hypothetical protein